MWRRWGVAHSENQCLNAAAILGLRRRELLLRSSRFFRLLERTHSTHACAQASAVTQRAVDLKVCRKERRGGRGVGRGRARGVGWCEVWAGYVSRRAGSKGSD